MTPSGIKPVTYWLVASASTNCATGYPVIYDAYFVLLYCIGVSNSAHFYTRLFSPFCFNDLPSLHALLICAIIFALTPSGWLHSVTLTPNF
jgi:hypothetical protein